MSRPCFCCSDLVLCFHTRRAINLKYKEQTMRWLFTKTRMVLCNKSLKSNIASALLRSSVQVNLLNNTMINFVHQPISHFRCGFPTKVKLTNWSVIRTYKPFLCIYLCIKPTYPFNQSSISVRYIDKKFKSIYVLRPRLFQLPVHQLKTSKTTRHFDIWVMTTHTFHSTTTQFSLSEKVINLISEKNSLQQKWKWDLINWSTFWYWRVVWIVKCTKLYLMENHFYKMTVVDCSVKGGVSLYAYVTKTFQ